MVVRPRLRAMVSPAVTLSPTVRQRTGPRARSHEALLGQSVQIELEPVFDTDMFTPSRHDVLSSRKMALLHAFMKLSRLLGLACLSLPLAGTTWAQEPEICPIPEWSKTTVNFQKWVDDLLLNLHPESEWTKECPHPRGWRPTEEELHRILSRHREWTKDWGELADRTLMLESAARNPGARANLCNANLAYCNFENAILAGAQMNGAILMSAKLNGASLRVAELNGVMLVSAKLNDANLVGAQLNGANLSSTELNNTVLGAAELNDALLYGSHLNNADLHGAQFKKARLQDVSVTGARLANADLTGATYSPTSAGPPDPFVAGIKGLATVTFPPGQEIGLVQLRDLLQRAGLRELEREATFAIEHGRTRHAIAGWAENPGDAVEGIFRMIAFDWTTGYGMYPGYALKIIGLAWALLIPVYFWPIRFTPKRLTTGGIFQVSPSDRIEAHGGGVSLSKSANVSRLQSGTLAALGRAAYFSLLSAFHIGWHDLNVGTWIARIQPQEYTLRATGWVRVVSGIQSLLSVYLLAMWALTYFGRPFQ